MFIRFSDSISAVSERCEISESAFEKYEQSEFEYV